MLSKSFNIVNSLLAHRLTRQVRELYTATLILNFAVAMVSIFEPVFLYVFFSKFYPLKGALEQVTLFYLGVYVIYLFIVPLGAKFAKRYGYESSIALASIFQIALYFLLFGMNRFYPAVILAIIIYAIAKAFYWPAYHSNFAKFSSQGEQGRELSNLYILEAFVFIAGPLLGGLILQFYGFKVLFLVVSVLILVSNIPMLITKEQFDPHPFAYRDAFKRLFSKNTGKKFLAHMGYGEEWIILNMWPIFMFLVASDYLGLGLISAISVFLSTAVLLFVGRWTDKSDKNVVLRYGTIFYFFSWLFKVLVRNPFGVASVDIFSRVAKNSIALPITADLYQEAQQGSVMNSIVFFEMSLVIGKIVAMLLCLLLLQIFTPGWNAMFILGAVMSLFYLFFKAR